jgi:hypothetical protein
MSTIVADIPSGAETVQFVNGNQVDQTSRKSGALHFGTIGPGELSTTIITAFRFKTAKAITNIKLGLVNTGGLVFVNNIFGIATYPAIDENLIPTTYFQGVNTDGLATNAYNIDIDNLNNIMSEYVYLNINLPNNADFGAGVIRLKWFFDYDD